MRRALLLLLSVALAAGCGGSAGKRLTRDEYASRADAVCAKNTRKIEALGRPSGIAGFARLAERTLPILHAARSDLRRLRPPAKEQSAATAWLDQFDVLIHDVEQLRDRARDGDAAGVQETAQKAVRDNRRANDLGAQLGMTVCSKD